MIQCSRAKFQDIVLGSLERVFEWYGGVVTRYPLVFILGAIALTGAASSGLMFLREEKEGLKLWLPKGHEYVENQNFMQENFPSKIRVSSILIVADNVLEPEIIKDIFGLLQDIKKIVVPTESPRDQEFFYRKNISEETVYEKMCKNMKGGICIESSILLAFKTPAGYNAAAIEGLSSLDDVLLAIHEPRPPFFNPEDLLTKILGSIEYTNGTITGAQATQLNFIGEIDGSEINDLEVDDSIKQFERSLVETVNKREHAPGMKAYPFTQTSLKDDVGGDIQDDIQLFSVGYVLIFIFFIFNLGRLNSVEQRLWLSVTGLVAIGMGVATAFGLASFMGVFTSQMNMLLYSLVLGVGIDDMFVIMQAFENLSPQEKALDLAKRLGLTMKHAGVAITITTITDLLAFAIGATTVIPALSSFCIYASLGLFFVYFYVITFFLAFFSYDQRRVEGLKDGCICCWTKKEGWTPRNKCSQESLLQSIFKKVSEVVVLLPVKIGVLLITVGIFAGGVYGAITLETNFDFNAFIDEGTFLRSYLELKELHFPGDGAGASIHFTALNYAADMDTIGSLVTDMEHLAEEERDNISPGSIGFWFRDFSTFLTTLNRTSFESYSEKSFLRDMKMFLCQKSPKYIKSFVFADSLDCFNQNQTEAPKVLLTSLTYKHPTQPSGEAIRAMKEVFAVVEKYEFSNDVFAIGDYYGPNIIMDIIGVELFRNMLMALGVVFLCTLVLIADFATSFIVLITVALTIINVAGYANFWGLDIDTLFAVFMTISIGLCVDYSAHIAHGFMVEKGDRNTRMKKTLVNVGPAVFNGGFSTFLSFIILSMSNSIIFLTYFKIFFLVVVFGLVHGLVFLPVLLSLAGPQSHGSLGPRGMSRVCTVQVDDPIADSNVDKAEDNTEVQ